MTSDKVIETIRLLIRLQACDSKIHTFRIKLERIPMQVENLDKNIEEIHSNITLEKSLLEQKKQERSALDREIDLTIKNINKSNEKLSFIKSNKEYQAVLKEIEDMEKAKFSLEDKAIGLMEQCEEAEKRVDSAVKAGTAEEKKLVTEKIALEGLVKKCEQEIIKITEHLDALKSSADKSILIKYERLLQRRNNVAVAPVVHGVCQACQLAIPPQSFNELMRSDEIMSCPHCGRLLYWGEHEKFVDITEQAPGIN